MPTTEIATLTLKPGSEIGDPDNAASATVNECCNILSKQPGLLHLRFGPQVEETNKMQMMIGTALPSTLRLQYTNKHIPAEWESIQNHKDFEASSAYPDFLSKFKTIMAGPPSFVHVDYPDPDAVTAALKAPVTEVATMYFKDGPPETYIPDVHQFVKAVGKTGQAAIGPTHEVIERDGFKGKGTVLIIGCETVEEHLSFRQTQMFQENRAKLTNGPGCFEVHHTTFMDFVAN